MKLRFHHADWRQDVEVVEAVRDAVGGDVEIMVDANQGWRMAGDRSARWDVATATQCARALEPLGVYWLEEPLRTDDVEGYALLRRRTSLRIAAGEMVRGLFEARDLILRGGVDVRAARRRARGRPRRLPADRGARRPLRPRVLAAHVDERLRPAREPAPRDGRLDLPVPRGAARPARLDARPGATGCSAMRGSRSPPTGRSRRRPGPGLGVVPDLDALEAHRVA